MNILGLSFDYHDAAAALVCDGRIVAAAQEERFSRKKNDPSLPGIAAAFCLKRGRIGARDLDQVVFYEKTMKKFDRIIDAARSGGPGGAGYLDETLRSWMAAGKFDVPERISSALGVPMDRISCVDHHQAHAASAFFCSPFERATIVTLDGVGEYETTSVSVGDGARIEKCYSVQFPDSIGLFYSAFTAFLGFEVNEGEYKVMGMAGFGKPDYLERIRPLLELDPDGTFRVSRAHFEFGCPEEMPYTSALLDLLGPARRPESPFKIASDGGVPGSDESLSRHFADVAASVQRLTEDAIIHVVAHAVKRTGVANVCLAGGVALNSLANGRLERELGFPLYVHPASGDAGGALGAALFHHHCVADKARMEPLQHAYLGLSHSMDDCKAALIEAGIDHFRQIDDENELLDQVAALIATGAVVGWFQGRFEWGPRALGARSILADPRRAEMQATVNEKIKFREPFRPFAPSILAHRADAFFELPPGRQPLCPEDFMLSVSRVRAEKRSLVPAITHVDGTARPQLVRQETNPRYFGLLEAFERRTGIPLILNTSFNRRGEPIVASPRDALETFQWTGLDYLVLGNLLIPKEP